MRIYLAGPMRGIPEFNFPAFFAAADRLKKAGHLVFNPAEHDVNSDFRPQGASGNEDLGEMGFDLRRAFAADTGFITSTADAVALLPGWETSSGARAELAVAAAVGLRAGVLEDFFSPAGSPAPELDDIPFASDLFASTFDRRSDMRCWICGDPDDHFGAPHGIATGDGRTREDVLADLRGPVLRLAHSANRGEVRITNPLTGGQKGDKLERFDLIPVGPLTALARHYGIGARKYADNQWRRGYDWHLSYAAAQRHLNGFWGGEDIDEETGSPHLAAAAWHCFALLQFAVDHPELDDRPTTVARRQIPSDDPLLPVNLAGEIYPAGLIPNKKKETHQP